MYTLRYIHMRIYRYGKIIEEVLSHYVTSLYSKARSPPYYFALPLGPRLIFSEKNESSVHVKNSLNTILRDRHLYLCSQITTMEY